MQTNARTKPYEDFDPLFTLKEVISTVAQEHGITVLLSRQQVMFLADKKMDVTEEVLTGINKKLPSVKVTFPAPQK